MRSRSKEEVGPELKTREGHDGFIDSHESFGLIMINRTANSHGMPLFGSSIEHRNTVRLSISRGELGRSTLHYDSFHGSSTLIEVEMSLSQFAEAITTQNTYPGIPCTIRYIDGKRMADPPYQSKRDQFTQEFEQKMEQLTRRMTELKKLANVLLEQPALKKAERQKLKSAIFEMCRIPEDHMPFFAKQFNEQMSQTVHEAKMEFAAHVQERLAELAKAGYTGLTEDNSPKMLEKSSEDEE